MKIKKSSILLIAYLIYCYVIGLIILFIQDDYIDEIRIAGSLILNINKHIILPYTIGIFIFNVFVCIYFRKHKNSLKLLFMVLLNGNTFFPYFIAIPELMVWYPISEIFGLNITVTITNIITMPFFFIEDQVGDNFIGFGYNPIIWIALGALFVFSLILYISLLKSNKRQKALDEIQNKIDSTHITKDNTAS